MGDARNTYIQERLEQGLEGWNFSPSVSSLLDQPKSKQVRGIEQASAAQCCYAS